MNKDSVTWDKIPIGSWACCSVSIAMIQKLSENTYVYYIPYIDVYESGIVICFQGELRVNTSFILGTQEEVTQMSIEVWEKAHGRK